MEAFTRTTRTAYFSMEIALRDEIPTYAGGLGVLAGDTLRSAADLDIPMVFVSLVSSRGHFRQALDARGMQMEYSQSWDPKRWARSLDARVSVQIAGRRVWIGGWVLTIPGQFGGAQPVVLLDTDVADNAPQDREITAELYGRDAAYRLRQEIVLGIGGARMLHALGFDVAQYHMNEGHSALLTLELLRLAAYPEKDIRPGEPRYDVPAVRGRCSFTTHTPVEAGHDKFPYELVAQELGDFVELTTLQQYGGRDHLNMTLLALNLSDHVNGVAKRHAEISRAMFPGYTVSAITNGVHPLTWTGPSVAALYDRTIAGWSHEPELLVRADCCIPDDELFQAHVREKQRLIEVVMQRCQIKLDCQIATIGFARRMTAYKRPDLLFSDLQRLRQIASKHPFQVVLAGKAHPHDLEGKKLIEHLCSAIRELEGSVAVAYLPDYGMEIAALLVAGSDLWLNTPLPPLEASGTSGMKAAFNGVPSLSVLDGWWLEGCIEGVTGWAIGDAAENRAPNSDATQLYEKLERVVLPLYYGERARWVAIMKGAIAKNASVFNSHRMMRRYAAEAYLR